MAILNAIADARGSNLLDILHSQTKDNYQSSMEVQVCALLDSNGSPAEVANVAAALVEEGFSAIKIKVSYSCNAYLLHILHAKWGGKDLENGRLVSCNAITGGSMGQPNSLCFSYTRSEKESWLPY